VARKVAAPAERRAMSRPSPELVGWALTRPLDTSSKLALVVLAYGADSCGMVALTQAELAEQASLSLRSARTHLHRLEAQGLIAATAVKRGSQGGTVYHVAPPQAATIASCAPVQAAAVASCQAATIASIQSAEELTVKPTQSVGYEGDREQAAKPAAPVDVAADATCHVAAAATCLSGRGIKGECC
jgi:hypothetical protein